MYALIFDGDYNMRKQHRLLGNKGTCEAIEVIITRITLLIILKIRYTPLT